MAKVRFTIPKTNAVIICRNKRETRMLEHLCIDIDTAVGVFKKYRDYDGLASRVDTIEGYMDAMYWLGMAENKDAFLKAYCAMFGLCIDMADDGTNVYDEYFKQTSAAESSAA